MDYLNGFFTGATLAFLLVAIWEIRDFRKKLKNMSNVLAGHPPKLKGL